jgi:hypothetical protein
MMAAVLAEFDDVTTWLGRREVPAEAMSGGNGWVGLRGLGGEAPRLLGELSGALGVTTLCLTSRLEGVAVDLVVAPRLRAEVLDAISAGEVVLEDRLLADPQVMAVAEDALALAVVCDRRSAAGEIAEILAAPSTEFGLRLERLAQLLGIPSIPVDSTPVESTPVKQAGTLQGPSDSTRPGSRSAGVAGVPTWLPVVVLFTGLATALAAVLAFLRADDPRGLKIAGLCAFSAVSCLVLGYLGRARR